MYLYIFGFQCFFIVRSYRRNFLVARPARTEASMRSWSSLKKYIKSSWDREAV
jgi:hypothetical protein